MPSPWSPSTPASVLGLALTLSVAAGFAPATAQARCFDFATKIVAPLKPALAAAEKGDAYRAGETSDGKIWTQLRGSVAKPAQQILAFLLNHDNLRDPEVDEMQVKKRESSLYLARHTIAYEVRPFPLVKIRWTEEWGYAADGPADAPTAWVVSYEKTEGTDHIQHFCGSIVLRRLADQVTDVYQYEESKIDRHDQADQTKGMRTLLAKLRKAL